MRPPRRSARTTVRQRTGAAEGELQPELQPRLGLTIIRAGWESESWPARRRWPWWQRLLRLDESPGSAAFVRRPGSCQGQDVTVRVEQVAGALAPRPVPQAVQEPAAAIRGAG